MRQLVAGDLTAELVGADLRAVWWRGVQVLDRVYGALRDDAWGTVPFHLSRLDVIEEPGVVNVTFLAEHDGLPFRWEGHYELRPGGLTAHFDGEATGSLAANRVGWCLLHPLTQVGGTVTHGLGGAPGELRLTSTVLPQGLSDGNPTPAWGPFETMTIDAQGVRCRFDFVGDLFESEDQRNWTDASFKTYSTPLARPRPRLLSAGDRIAQTVTVAFEAGAHPKTGPGEMPAGPHHSVVSALVSAGTSPAAAETALGFVDRLRAETRPGEDLASAIELARAGGRAWELSVLADGSTDFAALARLIAPAPPEVVFVVPAHSVSGAADEVTPDPLIQSATEHLSGLVSRVGGGTRWNFAELQRHPLARLGALSWTYSPTVHADDERSIWETLASYPAIVATARKRAPQALLSVGPLRDGCSVSPEWLAASCRAWANAGIDLLCPLAVSDLASDDGTPSPWADAVGGAR